MPITWFFIPILSAFTGWMAIRLAGWLLFFPHGAHKILGIKLQGVVPNIRHQLAAELAQLLSDEVFSLTELVEKAGPSGPKELVPIVDAHIDHFLKIRLPEEMPVVGMFIGDKTIAQLKALFMNEMELLFPVVMAGCLNKMAGTVDIKNMLTEKLLGSLGKKIDMRLRCAFENKIRALAAVAAVAGLLIGLLQLLIISAG